MKTRTFRAALALLGALAAAGCAEPPKKPTYSERIILLPNRDGRSSAVIVSRESGEQQISKPYESVELVGGKEERRELAKEDVEQRYGDVLEAQPARPFTYTLYFNMASTD